MADTHTLLPGPDTGFAGPLGQESATQAASCVAARALRDPEGNEPRALGCLVDFRGARVLEVGCGDGRLTWRYAAQASKVLGLDPSAERIALAQQHTPVELRSTVAFRAGKIEDLAVTPGEFDVVLFAWSL